MMKRLVFSLGLSLMVSGLTAQTLKSPDGAWQLTFSLQRGRPLVNVTHNAQTVIASHNVGIHDAQAEIGSHNGGLSLVGGPGLNADLIEKITSMAQGGHEMGIDLFQRTTAREFTLRLRLTDEEGPQVCYDFPAQSVLRDFTIMQDGRAMQVHAPYRTPWLNLADELAVSPVLREVNLFLGTADDYGQLAPGATVPFGQVQVCPDSRPRQHAGYDFEVPLVSGISLNRLSGVGGSGCGGNVSLMPDDTGRDIRILKTTEQATPGYYAAMLSNGVRLQLTATNRMAVERYAFPQGVEPVLVLNTRASFEKVHQSSFRLLGDREGQGMVVSSNTCGRGRYHLYYKLFADQPFQADTLSGGLVRLRFTRGQADERGDYPVEVRIVVSTGLESPLADVKTEAVWASSFRQLQGEAARQWAQVLGRVEVKGGSPDHRTLFYTSLYRVFHSPFQVTGDGVSSYLGTDGREHTATDGCYYSSWSLWDTYRTKFPMILLLQPERSRDIMNSLAQLYLTGKKDWSTDHECVPTVRTEHAIATLLDALRKGIVGPNMLRPAYPGMVAEAKRLSLKSPDQVLEAASDFWALGQLAAELGQKADAERFQQRGEALFDSIWPREFMNIDASYTKMKGNGLYQGTRWQYRWGAPMFLDRMIRLRGKKTLADELTQFFDEELYNQGNEPDIHVPFLFGRLGQPLRTGPVVQRLMQDSITHRYGGNDAYPEPFRGWAFRNATRGYAPEMDEDDGTMSAWYCFAALGLYPTIVGEPVYDLFSPLFDEAVLRMDEAGSVKTVIRTSGRRTPRQPLKRVTWNGQPLPTVQITHSQLARGGQLVFWY